MDLQQTRQQKYFRLLVMIYRQLDSLTSVLFSAFFILSLASVA